MTDLMDWNECEKNLIKKVEIDNGRVKSIIEKAMLRLDRAKKTKLSTNTVSLIVEDYYEVIKELLVAYLLKNGLRSKNHQCLISYFYKKNSIYEKEAHLISQMSFFRNRLNYYGEDIPMDFYTKNEKDFHKIINLLKNLIQSQKK